MPNQHTAKKKVAAKKGAGRPMPKVEYVTKKEFEDFGNRMVDAIEGLGRPAVEVPATVAVEYAPGVPGQTAVYQAPSAPAGDTITVGGTAPAPVETPMDRDIRKAGPSEVPMNPEWEEMARDIIGDAVDHCEISYLKNGGVLFTVVITPALSNATADYIAYYKSDRRSKEIGQEGLSGVEEWCKLIKSNLARNK